MGSKMTPGVYFRLGEALMKTSNRRKSLLDNNLRQPGESRYVLGRQIEKVRCQARICVYRFFICGTLVTGVREIPHPGDCKYYANDCAGCTIVLVL